MIETPKTILHVQKERRYNNNNNYSRSGYDKNSLLLQSKVGFIWTYHN
ncbi:MAG TPA: hypothetical protein VI278_01590 [Nitrososphaeraceae archaeon]